MNHVIEAIHAAFQMEIANQFTTTEHTLTVTLPDHGRIVITAQPIDAYSGKPVATPQPAHDAHTFHYIHQHDYGYGHADEQPLNRLMLHNLAECRAYVDDVCHTFLVAQIHDNEITFPDGAGYVLMINNA